MDYYFWNRIKRKTYEYTLNTSFESEEEMISKIKLIWKECASSQAEIRKSMKEFPGRLRAVNECNEFFKTDFASHFSTFF